MNFFVNGVRRNALLEDSQRSNGEFIDQWFPEDNEFNVEKGLPCNCWTVYETTKQPAGGVWEQPGRAPPKKVGGLWLISPHVTPEKCATEVR